MSEPKRGHGRMKHPRQPAYVDQHGVIRFKPNAIVAWLVSTGRANLTEIACQDFPRRDREQFDQLHGYSVSGAPHLFDDTRAAAQAEGMAILAKRRRRS